MAGPGPANELPPTLRELLNQAAALQQRGQPAAAADLYRQVLRQKKDCFDALYRLGMLHIQHGRFDDAFESLREALQAKPDSVEVLSDFGVLLHMRNRLDEALASFDKALLLQPAYANAHNNRGKVLGDLGRYEEALASYDRALAERRDFFEALNNRGLILQRLQRHAEALASFDKALAGRPNYTKALYNRGTALAELGRLDEALASYVRALAQQPDYAEAHFNRGNVLVKLGRHEEALPSFDKAIAVKPSYADAYDNRGSVLAKLRRHAEALASHERALALDPRSAGALSNRGNALKSLRRYEEALASYDAALAIAPDAVDTLYNRGNLLKEMQRFDVALDCYDKASSIAPDHSDAFGWVDAALHICDWRRTEDLTVALGEAIRQGKPTVTPFTLLSISDDPALHLQCARNYLAETIPAAPEPMWKRGGAPHDKMRIAYLSADLHAHATAYLIAELIEVHDRSRFEISAISYGHDDGSDMRRRLVKAFDRFHDVSGKSDLEVARLINALEIDIAVDLKGYTKDARPEILSHRPAPIQVIYLGYTGTMAADFIDYVIADAVVVPFAQQPFYSERIVQLPDTYEPNDSKRSIAATTLTRAQAHLPDSGFVFCCFNNNYKINRAIFDIWMRLLDQVPGSVLWLLQGNAAAEANLRAAAEARGVSGTRLVFGERMPLEEHLARHRLADLFLDTFPYNAHTTTSDALWAGLPVLTCLGASFAGRVAASLLNAVGLPELVTSSLADYEAAALRLARDATSLRALRAKLEHNRCSYPLFDTDRYRRHIEAAYMTMWEHHQNGAARSFAVEAIETPGR
ncbi:MAG TPA: tetratricopeptide repeat protein [Xanthobacteraceae bacterium]